MNEIYIVDAVNYLFRAYYAIGPMTDGSGRSTSAVYGFIRSIQKLFKMFQPKHIVCVFDGPDNKKSRQEVFADYKAHRKAAPEDLFPQFEWAFEYCRLAGIPTLMVEGVEADDVMASVALWAEKKGAKAYLCTSDKDLAQLVGQRIFLRHPHKDYLLIDEAKVEEIFGVRPDQILDYLSITGDASDNIPGIEGFGPKTAAALLNEFGTLDNILKSPEKVKGEKKQQILREQKETALLSRKLATLHTNIEIPENPEYYRKKEEDLKKLSPFYHTMNFQSLLREMEEIPTSANQSAKEGPVQYHLVDNLAELKSLLDQLAKEKEIGIDTETTNIQPMLAHLVGIGFCIHAKQAWYVPLNGTMKEEDVVLLLKIFFEKSKCSFYGHNLKYDWHVLANLGIFLKAIGFDTILASYLLDPQNRRHNLDDLVLEKFKHAKIPIESLIGKGKNEISMRDVPLEKVKDYCCEDVDYTSRLKELFETEIEKKNLKNILYDIELPLLPILGEMERFGIYLDVAHLAEIGHELTRELFQIKAKIFEEVGEEFNLNSPKQLSEILFSKLNLRKPPKSKTAFATGADVLEELALENPIANQILNYRSLEKLRATYVEALPHSINPHTGRIHCTFNQSVAATGRLSCQNPNLQNIPIRSKEGNAIRSCFKPKKGWSFVGGDYSQIELRLLAHFSEDPELLKAFKENEDIHEHTASRIFNLPITMITPEMRTQAKTVNFGILYGQGAFGLSKQLGISMKEASDFIKTYFERYPSISKYLEESKELARKRGYSTTFTGRQRPIPEINNKNPAIRAAAERLAVNTPLQGTAADLIKKAMIEIDLAIRKEALRGRMILQIHDELIFEVPDEEVAAFKQLVKAKMENVFKLKVPIEVHIAVGKNWAEC